MATEQVSAAHRVHEWPEGSAQLTEKGECFVVDGDGVVQVVYRVMGGALRVCTDYKAQRPSWRDASETWAKMPAWVRKAVTEQVPELEKAAKR